MKTVFDYIPRTLEKDIELSINLPEIIAIVGPRQCGKTTLMHHIAGKLSSQEVSITDFEDRDELNLFTHDIKAFAELHVKDQDYLFIDEFQYAPDGGKNLKYLYDHFPVKILITGSSSTELSLQGIRHLVGRIFVYNLYPLCFQEILNYKDPKLSAFITGKSAPGPEIISRINKYYTEYIIYGGYPRVVLSSTVREKETVIRNIYNTYLLREIRDILRFKDDYKLAKLIHALALQIGSTFSYNELSDLTGFKYRELTEAINILEKTFVVVRSAPFYRNKRLELVKSPRLFFLDNGFRNMAIKNFLPLSNRTDTGVLNENCIAKELVKHEYQLHYWRTKSKAEVDFIVEKHGKIIPVEVKTTLKQPNVTRSFMSFIEKYSPLQGIVTSDSLVASRDINDIPTEFVPHWYLFSILNK